MRRGGARFGLLLPLGGSKSFAWGGKKRRAVASAAGLRWRAGPAGGKEVKPSWASRPKTRESEGRKGKLFFFIFFSQISKQIFK
jgi:hypothetical protein